MSGFKKRIPPQRGENQRRRIQKIYGYPTATVVHSRVPIFQATRKAKRLSKWIWTTSWGSVEVTGRLGQVHRDLHDLIMTEGEKYRLGDMGDLHVLLDPAKIQRHMGIRSNPRHLDSLLEDMRQARVTVTLKNGESSLGGIVSVVDKKAQESAGPGGFMKKRFLWQITISRTWVNVYQSNLRIRYAPALPTILALKSGYSQAMARFFLTHQGKMSLDFSKCLAYLGIIREPKKVRLEMKRDFPLLERLGVRIEESMVRYQQVEGMVSFESAPEAPGQDVAREEQAG
jgi:hypothetical protein